MTGKEFERERRTVQSLEMSPERTRRGLELECISMINSVLAYDCQGLKKAEAVMQSEEQGYYNYLAKFVEEFGREYVLNLIQNQIDDIEEVKNDVFTDDEGISYNEIVWKERW